MQNRASIFSEEITKKICAKLELWSNPDTGLKEQHIQQVQDRMFGDVCPVCGKKLVTRNGKKGTFIGCTGYPKCKYTREK